MTPLIIFLPLDLLYNINKANETTLLIGRSITRLTIWVVPCTGTQKTRFHLNTLLYITTLISRHLVNVIWALLLIPNCIYKST